MKRPGDAIWRSLLGRIRSRRPESQNLFRYLATMDQPVATVTRLDPAAQKAEQSQRNDIRLSA